MSRTFLNEMDFAALSGGRSSVWRDLGEIVTGEGATLSPSAPASPMTVLIVEDDAAAACLLVPALAEAGHALGGPAARGAVAARLAEQYPVDVALIGGEAARDGRADTFARRLRETWPLRVVRLGDAAGVQDGDVAWDATVPAAWRTSEVLAVLDRLARAGAEAGGMVGDVGLEPTTR